MHILTFSQGNKFIGIWEVTQLSETFKLRNFFFFQPHNKHVYNQSFPGHVFPEISFSTLKQTPRYIYNTSFQSAPLNYDTLMFFHDSNAFEH